MKGSVICFKMLPWFCIKFMCCLDLFQTKRKLEPLRSLSLSLLDLFQITRKLLFFLKRSLSLSLSHTHMHAHTHTHACTHVRTLHTHTDTHACTKTLPVWRLLLHSSQWWSMPRVLVQDCQFQGFSLLLCCASGAGDVFQWRGFTSGAAFRGEGCHTRLVGTLCCLHLLFWKAASVTNPHIHLHNSCVHTYAHMCMRTDRHLSYTHTHC